jgi:UDP-3-O-[3-hydroxymyristoyl] N-acetylglucosamine deacetylase
VLSALMADKSAWTLVEADTVRPGRGHADVATGHVAVAYAPDVS